MRREIVRKNCVSENTRSIRECESQISQPFTRSSYHLILPRYRRTLATRDMETIG